MLKKDMWCVCNSAATSDNKLCLKPQTNPLMTATTNLCCLATNILENAFRTALQLCPLRMKLPNNQMSAPCKRGLLGCTLTT